MCAALLLSVSVSVCLFVPIQHTHHVKEPWCWLIVPLWVGAAVHEALDEVLVAVIKMGQILDQGGGVCGGVSGSKSVV